MHKSNLNLNCAYVCFVNQMCKLKTKLGGSLTDTPYGINLHLFLCNKQSVVKYFPEISP